MTGPLMCCTPGCRREAAYVASWARPTAWGICRVHVGHCHLRGLGLDVWVRTCRTFEERFRALKSQPQVGR